MAWEEGEGEGEGELPLAPPPPPAPRACCSLSAPSETEGGPPDFSWVPSGPPPPGKSGD